MLSGMPAAARVACRVAGWRVSMAANSERGASRHSGPPQRARESVLLAAQHLDRAPAEIDVPAIGKPEKLAAEESDRLWIAAAFQPVEHQPQDGFEPAPQRRHIERRD